MNVHAMNVHAMNVPARRAGVSETKIEVRVRGRVQGVGFRPTVWRLATELGLHGEVLNDADGVLVRIGGGPADIALFLDRLEQESPPLGHIDSVATRMFAGALPDDFRIVESIGGAARTQVAPDAALCPACMAEITDPFERRYRYAFANCTHCGPRLSIVKGIPYDRATTTMAAFPLCAECEAEYRDPSTAASTPRRSPATRAGRVLDSCASTARSPVSISIRCSTTSMPPAA